MNIRRSCAAVLLALPAACGSPSRAVDDGDATAPVGAVEHRYELPAAQVWAVAQTAVEEEDAVVELRRARSDGGEIVVRRPEGHRVRATVTAVEPHAARVSVAVTPPNETLAAMIQGRIGERLSLRKAQEELFGESSVETVYPRSLAAAVEAAERACGALDMEVVRRTTFGAHARVEARDRNSRFIRFSFRRIGDGNEETAVMFTAEAAGEDRLEHLRREFERHLFPARE